MPVESACVQQIGARDRAAERYEVWIGRVLQELDDHTGDADRGRARRRSRRFRRLPRRLAARDVEAGLRSRFEDAAIFKQAISLHGGRHAHLALAADRAQ